MGPPGGAAREGVGGEGVVPGGKGESETVCWERRFVAGGEFVMGCKFVVQTAADSSFFLPLLEE